MRTYVVKAGEHLGTIALREGLAADAIWNHPRNAALRAQRKSANILASGDVLALPDAPRTPLLLKARTANRFVGTVPTLTVRAELRDERGPIANEPFVVTGEHTDETGTTDAAGLATFEAATADKQVTLELTRRAHAIHLAVGGLDPIDTVEGVQSRLAHLGLLRGQLSGRQDARTEAAVRAFQKSQALAVTGLVDDATAAALQAAYGC